MQLGGTAEQQLVFLIRAHLQRGGLCDGLVFDAVRIRRRPPEKGFISAADSRPERRRRGGNRRGP
jgi:hypothetical protein